MSRIKHENLISSPIISRLRSHEVPLARMENDEAFKLKDKVLAMIKLEKERCNRVRNRVLIMQSQIRDGRAERDKLREEVKLQRVLKCRRQ